MGKNIDEKDVQIILNNQTEKIMLYSLYWVDHKWREKYPHPINIAGGELQPGMQRELSNPFPPGTYFVRWSPREILKKNEDDTSFKFMISDESKRVIVNRKNVQQIY